MTNVGKVYIKIFVMCYFIPIFLFIGGHLIYTAIEMGIEGTKHVRMQTPTQVTAPAPAPARKQECTK